MENQSPLPDKGAELPPPKKKSAHVYCGQTAGCIKMPLGMEVGLGVRDIVLDVDPATPREKGTPTPTQFLSHVHCGQMAGWMKRPLGTEVDLGLGHIVLDGVQAKGAQPPPLFGPCLLWPRSPISGVELGLVPGDFVLDGDPAPPPQKGGSPPIFGPCLL